MSSVPPIYLKTLNLVNFAIFRHQTINFNHKFMAIIGETGSGKSLLLDALEIILGGPALKKLVRKSAKSAAVEAIFFCKSLEVRAFFDDIGYPIEEDEIIIKRIIYPNLPSKSYLNYNLCNANTLIKISKRFVDFVGQFENQKLLNENYQLSFLDQFQNLSSLKNQYQKEYYITQKLDEKLEILKKTKNSKDQRIEFLIFKLNEIKSLNPSLEDEKELINLKAAYFKNKKFKQVSNEILDLLSENDYNNALLYLKKSIGIYNKNIDILDSSFLKKLEDASYLVEDIAFSLSKKFSNDSIDCDMDYVLDRLDKYQKLKLKFKDSIEKILIKVKEYERELCDLKDIDFQVLELEKIQVKNKTKLLNLANQLHIERVNASAKLSKEITDYVQKLKMDGASIAIKVEKNDLLDENGLSRINILAQTNEGEGFYKLKEIVSGGELSRILLAIRQVMASLDPISIFLFDEIDSGIGGETALSIGKALKDVSINSQVIVITHWPQVAYYANKLIKVYKECSLNNDNKRTISKVEEISGKTKQEIIRSMMPLCAR